MSYDGGLVARIENNQLLDILKKYDAKGTFEGAEAIINMFGTKYNGKTLAIDYEYYDCAYVDGCPKNLSSVFNYVMDLLDVYGDMANNRIAFKEFLSELKASRNLIDSGYTFVEWIYFGDNSNEKFTYENSIENYNPNYEEEYSYDDCEYDEDESDFICETPDEELYPHYKNLKSAPGMFGGMRVIVNSGGTEYSFVSFRNALENIDGNEDDAEMSALYKRVIEKDTQNYTLHQKAKEMQKLFHVNESVFDFRHDRECEIEQGLMRCAYMMSALRSFAWTVAEYCDNYGMDISDISYESLNEVVEFIADRDWLNYNGGSYCQGLCGCSDLHVFYVPDSVSQSDKDMLRPSEEDYETFRQMKARFPSYNEILSDVHSLDLLRKDLEFIFPAVETLYNYLKELRDYNEELKGNEADIVYAWCALASAAKEPFFSEDGPSTCFFTHIADSSVNNSYSNAVDDSFKESSYNVDNNYEDEKDDDDCYGDVGDFCAEDWEKEGFVIEGTELTCYNGTSVNVSIPYGVTRIDDFTFDGGNIESIYIPDSVTEIGDYAFTRCDSLKNIIFSKNITKISDNMFSRCSLLEKIIIPDGVTEIGDNAFYECSSLKEIIIPDSVTKIGSSAFYDCSLLEKIIIPDGVTEIGDDAFYECSSLKEIIIPDSVTKIGSSAFRDCSSIEKINIPDGVTEIGSSAFYNCSSLEKINIPDGVTEIGNSAFYGCEKLIRITIPDSVIQIGIVAFDPKTTVIANKGSYTERYGMETNYLKVITNEEFLDERFEISDKTFYKYSGTDDAMNIPDGITRIGCCAFEECSTIRKIIIPDSVTEIDAHAFANCSSLESIEIPDGITKIENGTFYGCKSLKTISVPDSVEEICDRAFQGCESLTEVHLSYSTKKIGYSAFSECSNLKMIVIPDSVTEIDYSAFEYCSNLETIILSDNLTKIGGFAFDECNALERIVIPESVTEIGDYAFPFDITIFGESGSYAEEYAEENDLNFIG